MASLSLSGINKSFGETAVLHDVNLEIGDKEFVVFVGPSGCGKSTLLRIIAGLDEPTTGKLSIGGKDARNAHPIERGVTMVFQSYALYPHLSVFENIAFPLRVANADHGQVREKVLAAAEILQLGDRLEFKPGQLSGGQRQRVAIGRAIVREPEVFLFDEPLSNLDAALRNEMRVELARLHQRLGTTMIYVTHDQVEAMTMADRIVVLSEGVIQQYGSPMQLFHHPANLFVAKFIGSPSMNLLAGKCASPSGGGVRFSTASLGDIDLPVTASAGMAAGQEATLGVRPDDLQLSADGDCARLRMHIEVLERLGNDTVAYGNLVDGSDAASPQGRLCAVLPGDADLAEHSQVDLFAPLARCHLFDEAGNACQRRQAPASAS